MAFEKKKAVCASVYSSIEYCKNLPADDDVFPRTRWSTPKHCLLKKKKENNI